MIKLRKITKNSAICNNCKTTIESTSTEVVRCPCKGIWISGGLKELKRGCVNAFYFIENSKGV